jgi:glycosyltransferase involved in cell wall biosynthesis
MDSRPPRAGAPLGTSVVICAFADERLRCLQEAVASAREQTVAPREIVVVIDHNAELLARARRSLGDATVLANTGAPGAGEARNTGAAASSGAVLAFLDDDACAAPDWNERALAAFAHEGVLGVGGTIEPAWERGSPRWFPREFNWTVGCTYPGLPTTSAPVRNLIAANMFVSRSVFERLGGFRSGFGKQGQRSRPEETDLCLRANARWPEGVWLHDPAVRVRHRVPAARGRRRYFLVRCYNEGLGKAALARYLDSSAALATERHYTRRVLPAGFAAGVRDTLTRRDLAGVARSGAILAGLGATTAGYAHGRMAGQTAEARRA